VTPVADDIDLRQGGFQMPRKASFCSRFVNLLFQFGTKEVRDF